MGGTNTKSESAVGLSAAGQSGDSELERAIANHVQNLVDAKFFFTEDRGKASAEEIEAYREALDKQIRYKLSLLSSVDDFIFVNKVDMEIKDAINFSELKREFAMDKITVEEIGEKYERYSIREVLNKGLGRYWRIMKEK